MTSATAGVALCATEILEAYVVGSDIMEPRPPAPVDIDKTFDIKTDLNYLFGGAHGYDIIKLPYEETDNTGNDEQQASVDRFYNNVDGGLIEQRGRDVRKRIGTLLQNLQSMTLTNGNPMRAEVENQLIHLFQEHELQGSDANIKINSAAVDKGLLKFKNTEVDAFVQSHEYRVDSGAFDKGEGPKGLATAIFTAGQTAQLLQGASVLRRDIVTVEGVKHAELKLVDGDKLSCIVKVRATDNDEYDPEDQANVQHWEISFVQTSTADLQTDIDDWLMSAVDYSEAYVPSSEPYGPQQP